jgi:hypothetical protein
MELQIAQIGCFHWYGFESGFGGMGFSGGVVEGWGKEVLDRCRSVVFVGG